MTREEIEQWLHEMGYVHSADLDVWVHEVFSPVTAEEVEDIWVIQTKNEEDDA